MDIASNQDSQELTTPMPARPPQRKIWGLSLGVSAAIHGVFLLVLCWPAAPIFVKPNFIAHGEAGTATPVTTALYLHREVQMVTQDHPSQLSVPFRKQAQKEKSKARKRLNDLDMEKPADSAEAGSKLGSAIDGPATGDEVQPALPVAFQDPRIARWELPSGLQGDVIVEITIDTQGNVVEERLLQGLGHGVDEKVIAALHDWHFRPATRNGVAISSKHDVHFHFPS